MASSATSGLTLRSSASRQASTASNRRSTDSGVHARAARAAEKGLEKRQKSRATRTQRDVLDLALIDLAGFLRDVLVVGSAAEVPLTCPDRAADVERAARRWTPESALRRLEAVLACRDALDRNVKPLVALEAMLVAVQQG